MIENETIVRLFFEGYEALFNQALLSPSGSGGKDVSSCFAEYFIDAAPSGVVGRKNNLKFRWAIPRSFASHRKAGMKMMNLTGVTIMPVDEFHVMAKVAWDARYVRKDGEEICIPSLSHYLLQIRDGEPKIFAFISGGEKKAMGDHGLVI